MADATITSVQPALVEVTSSNSILTLDPSRVYTLFHTGKDSAGSDATGDIFGDVSGDRVASYAADTDKVVIQSGKSIAIGPGFASYNVITASDSPMLQVIPGERISAAAR